MRGKDSKLCRLVNVDGVGVDLTRFYLRSVGEKEQLRREYGYGLDDFIIVNVAEINKNKNQMMLVEALPELTKQILNLKILFLGKDNYPKVKDLVDSLNVSQVVDFLGYRHDVDKLLAISNLAFSASLREGLPVNIIEAMASGIPVVCSKNRGHNQLIEHDVTGLLFSVNNPGEMIRHIVSVYKNPVYAKLALAAREETDRYSANTIIEKMGTIYNGLIHPGN